METSRRINPLRLVLFLGWILLGGALLVAMRMFFPAVLGPRCASLLIRSTSEAQVPLSDDCAETMSAPPDAMMRYLDAERKSRGLIFRKWVVCRTAAASQRTTFPFDRDPRWLPSYVPRTYQFRRTVVILPYARPLPEGSRIAGEVCVVPWRRYTSQIAGECGGEFSYWK